jgi:hypothetical protein
MKVHQIEKELAALVTTGQLMDSVRMKFSELTADKYGHRETEELDKPALQSLIEDITENRQVTPILFTVINGKNVVLDGHRRFAAIGFMMESKVETWFPDPLVLVQEVVVTDEVDRLVYSLNGNASGLPLSTLAKYRGAKALHEAHAQKERVQRVLHMSDTDLDRCYRLIHNEWMFQHIAAFDIGLSDANKLLEAAVNSGFVDQTQKDLTGHFARILKRLKDRDKDRREAGSDGLKAKDWHLMKELSRHEVDSWVDAIKERRSFAVTPPWRYKAQIETYRDGRAAEVKISAVNCKVIPAKIDDLCEVQMRLKRVMRDLDVRIKSLEAQRAVDYQLKCDLDAEKDLEANRVASLTPPRPMHSIVDPALNEVMERTTTDPFEGVDVAAAIAQGVN